MDVSPAFQTWWCGETEESDRADNAAAQDS